MNEETTQALETDQEQSSVKLREKLQEQLFSPNPSVRRQAAFNLSWLQEDGLEVLENVLFGDAPKATRNAATYGLRKMRGRMKKNAREILDNGLKHQNPHVRDVCRTAIKLLTEKKKKPQKETVNQAKKGKIPIREISHEHPQRRVSNTRTTNAYHRQRNTRSR